MRAVLTLVLVLLPSVCAQERLSPEFLWDLARIGGGSLSPDGTTVLFSVRKFDLAANRGDTDLWTVPIAGGPAEPLVAEEGSPGDAQWVKTPAGVRVFVVDKRTADAPQVWSFDPKTGTWTQVTDIPGGVANLKVSPTGRHLAFTRDVKLDKTVNDLYSDLPKANARIIDGLMFRHWNTWHDHRYTHLHVLPLADDGTAGQPIDLMEGLRVDCPIPPFGGSEQFNWSPDGKAIAWSAKAVDNFAQSTDSSVFVKTLDGDRPSVDVSVGMPGYDMEPAWSPDGRYLAFMSMARGGFESDRNRIMLRDGKTGAISELTEGLDQTAHDLHWAPDSKSIYFRAEHRGTDQIFNLRLEERALRQVTEGNWNWSLRDVSADGSTLVLARQDMVRPPELFAQDAGGGNVRQLTDVNGARFAKLALPKVEEKWVIATDGKRIHCWVIYPPDFDPDREYPLLTYFQGGPQGQIGQSFSYRWNFHLMAARGYVVVAPNRRGLPGFGRAWNDQISKDWGGQAMQDILSAHDHMVKEPYIDAKRCGGVGASFGGYTAYWMMGNAGDRFAALVAHCGVMNLESMYGSTEELFFVDWDLGGPYWKDPAIKADYDRFSPNRFTQNWKTPLLVIHGEKDFRVPVTQGIEAFTSAQVQGVPSRFLYFPEEGHWVLGPQNGVLWHRVFFDWLDRWLDPRRG
jgi:dipeptidyl aminopeptidase/acylaminoacyl peptidase